MTCLKLGGHSPMKEAGEIFMPTIDLERVIGYQFHKPYLLEMALTHKSRLQGQQDASLQDNERLEFLGDAVLALIVTEYLTESYSTLREGELSQIRARLVGGAVLAEVAARLDLGRFLRLGRGEEQTQGRQKRSLLADGLEAVIAAVYMDGGLEAARSVVLTVFKPELHDLQQVKVSEYRQDYKSQLQEWCQKEFGVLPDYHVTRETGPDHDKQFAVHVRIQENIQGQGVGPSKKVAEQKAAQQALATITDSEK